MAAGFVLGMVAAVLFALGVEPHLPPAVLRLVVYKMAFLGALGLFAAGAVLRRRQRQQRTRDREAS
jgi:MYXO-CTERM domain-containing protein